ncbi:MAG: ROK family glucokinase [Lachnospiraceae bacterium]|nr:ROK family glucokinase [Lachnospiraceae bacterium]
MKKYGFGVDVGGTTCKMGLFETNGTLLEKWEIPTNTANNGESIPRDIVAAVHNKMIEKGLSKEDVEGIGIGVPGAVTEDGVVNKCVNLGWGVIPIVAQMEELSGLKVRAANDANIAALGEAWMGAGKGCHSVVMVTLGTGIGGGIILNNKILTGFNGAAGEIGHIVVNEDEILQCNCGSHGCIEQYASATGIVMMAHRHLDRSKKNSPLREMEDFTAKDVFDQAKAGDELAKEVIHTVCYALGKMIATVCNVVNPEAVLIGGGVSKAGQIIIDEIREGFDVGVFHACANTKIMLATLGNDAGIYGGVGLIIND